jgi:alkylation response protein AidB-like acyl-CoA dehydrogenase
MSLLTASSRLAARSGRALASRLYTTHSQLPEEHRMVYEMCRKFADEELAPKAGEWDKKHEFPTDAVTQLVRAMKRGLSERCNGRMSA